MSDLKAFYFLMVSQIILLIMVSMYAVYMVELKCPSVTEFEQIVDDNPYDETSPVTALTNIWLMLGAIFSGCSGIPWWIYIIVFVPAIIAIVVYVVPFVGN